MSGRTLMFEMFAYEFMGRALIVGVLISICAALVGVPLVLKNRSMLGDGLSHTAFGAVAMATVLGLAPLAVSIPIVIIISFLLLKSDVKSKMTNDAKIAILSASSLAMGTLLISVVRGVNIDLNSYLFGSILALDLSDMILVGILTIITVIFYLFCYHQIFAVTFDETFARAIGIRTNLYNAIFAGLCSLVVVLGMRILGSLLISSLLIFPTLSAMQIVKKFSHTIIVSVTISVFAFILGLMLSYLYSTPTGATVVITNLVIFLVCIIVDKIVKK